MKRIIMTAVLAIYAPLAFALPVTWEFFDLFFFDGTAITGSFVYDADTQVVSSVNVATADGFTLTCATFDCDPNVPDPFPFGGFFAGVSYEIGGLSFAPNSFFFSLDTGGAGLGGVPLLFLQFDGPLTNSGGMVGLPDGASVEFLCNVGDDFCNTTFDVLTIPFRSNIAGGFIRAVPEPSMLVLLIIGLACLYYRNARPTLHR